LKHLLHAVVLVMAVTTAAWAVQRLTAVEAASHVGEKATVCGRVASAHFAGRVLGRPTFLDIDRPWPHQIFTAIIWGDRRHLFSSPPESWRGRRLCVTGVITTHKGTPQIIVQSPSQLEMEGPPPASPSPATLP
jgi:hypothetical protein